MLAGGGVAWATAAMKAGRFAVPPAPPGARPDLAGLSCRWTPIAGAARRDRVAARRSRARGVDAARVAPVLASRARGSRRPRPARAIRCRAEGPDSAGRRRGWTSRRVRPAAAASRCGARQLKVALATLVAWILDRTGWKVGGFDPANYRGTTARNADFRKFDDGLRLTVDCDAATRAASRPSLRAAAAAGTGRLRGLTRRPAP